ncbi:MAG: DUF1153 domain-containing protein [Alphaproteobacteria bacterium]|nr:DUF1153 domain-containing protein [Alphaproteobacteria bacterium]
MHGEQAKIVRLSDRQKEIDKLPPPDTKRWVMRRKAQVVNGVRKGLLSMEEACQRYRISEEEFKTWARLLDSHGVRALRVTRIKEYRSTDDHLNGATSVAE